MTSFGRSLILSLIALGLSTAAFAQSKNDAGSGPTSGATSTNDAGSPRPQWFDGTIAPVLLRDQN
jgi:hypothetical protein